jgi:hypothetical protein
VFNLSGPGGSPTAPPSLGTFATGDGPAGLEVSPDGRYLYVTTYNSGGLQVFDLQASPTAPPLAATVSTGSGPNALVVANNLLYLTNATANTLYTYGLTTPASPAYQSSTPTGGNPYGFDVLGNYAYLTNTSSNQVRVLQLTQSNSLGFNSSGQLTSVPNSALGDNLGNGVATTNVNLNGNLLVGGTLGTPGTTGLFVAANGNVGVGALAPAQKLDVRGNLRLGADNATFPAAGSTLELVGPGLNSDVMGLYRQNVASNQSELRVVVGDDPSGSATADKLVLGTTTASTTDNLAGGTFTPQFAVLSNGSTGIGTATPRGRLDVASGDTYLVADANSGSSQSVYLPGHLYLAPYSGSSGTAFVQGRVATPTAATNVGLTFRTTSNGNLLDALGIGAAGNVSTPYTFQLTSGDQDKIFLTSQGATGSKIGHATGWGVLNYAGPGNTVTTGYHAWLTTTAASYAEQMRLTTVGLRIGAGTTNPAATLHVAGSGSTVRLEGLAGSGTRVVTAAADGTLSTTAQQSGSVAVGGSTSGTGFKTVTVTFPTAYASAPGVVLCTARNEAGSNYDDSFSVTVRNVSATGFTVNIKRVDSATDWGQNLLLNWIALP